VQPSDEDDNDDDDDDFFIQSAGLVFDDVFSEYKHKY
jgi:hypothetical protein